MNQIQKPTPEKPFLTGILVDVSASMNTVMKSTLGRPSTRLENLTDALDNWVTKAKDLSTEEGETKVAPLIKVFAYGFGFGNPLQILFGNGGPDVRNLLGLEGKTHRSVTIDELSGNWLTYRRNIERLTSSMLGATPIGRGFLKVIEVFSDEMKNPMFTGNPVLFVISDGEPTDSTPDEIQHLADNIRKMGVTIISCYVTDVDIVAPRHLYNQPMEEWTTGAKLMFHCASLLPTPSPFEAYLREFKWKTDPNCKLFTQINQAEILSEFLGLLSSPLQQDGNYTTLNSKREQDSIAEKKRLIEIHRRRLQKLMEQQAIYGYSTHPAITVEIEDLQITITKLEKELNDH